MAYVELKVWSFSDDIANNCEKRNNAMKEGHTPHYTVKTLIDTSSCKNFIRKNVVDKLGISYAKPPQHILKRVPNALDTLISCYDNFNGFVVVEEPKADLVLGLPWLRLRESKVDLRKGGITIYGIFLPFIENSYSCEVYN
ncbi:hypothetical protein C1646_677358 [Rhizophagus diaphanus]|nr:hypothetical protein C1646_677358 [Rhizophagus diaphanus] [Rhizophagus sp. MUCL 43196]